MKRSLLLAVVVLLALATSWRPALRSAAAASNPDQVTMTLTYTATATMNKNDYGGTSPIASNRSLTVAALKAHRSRDRKGAIGTVVS
jgi:predicted component of type VI protein secretion system